MKCISYSNLTMIRNSEYLDNNAEIIVLDNEVYIISPNNINTVLLSQYILHKMDKEVLIKVIDKSDIDVKLHKWINNNYAIKNYQLYKLIWVKKRNVNAQLIMIDEDGFNILYKENAKQLLNNEIPYHIDDEDETVTFAIYVGNESLEKTMTMITTSLISGFDKVKIYVVNKQ